MSHARATHPRATTDDDASAAAEALAEPEALQLFPDGPEDTAVIGLLLAVCAWRLVRRLAAPAIIIALAMMILHSASFTPQDGRQAVGAVERVVRPLKHDVQHAFGKAFGP